VDAYGPGKAGAAEAAFAANCYDDGIHAEMVGHIPAKHEFLAWLLQCRCGADYRCPFGKCQMERMIVAASVLLLSALFSACTSSQPSQSNPPFQLHNEPKTESPSPEVQAYQKAVKDYNDFVEHSKGHVYIVRPKERGLELCYLSAQVVVTAVRVPEFSEDLNSDGEIKEWRRWLDIRKYQLHCDQY
jgi:hypothetical protein